MAKVVLNTIGSRYGSIDALNANFTAIEEAFENTFSRDGEGPNALEANLDAGSFRIINLPAPVGATPSVLPREASAATLRLVLPDGTPVPAGASVTTRNEQVPVALDGLVYLTAAAGRHEATAEWLGSRCRFAFERPDEGDPQPDLGTITCVAGSGGTTAKIGI